MIAILAIIIAIVAIIAMIIAIIFLVAIIATRAYGSRPWGSGPPGLGGAALPRPGRGREGGSQRNWTPREPRLGVGQLPSTTGLGASRLLPPAPPMAPAGARAKALPDQAMVHVAPPPGTAALRLVAYGDSLTAVGGV